MTALNILSCSYASAGQCGSCTTIGTPYEEALRVKDAAARAVLSDVIDDSCWQAPAASSFRAFRNKAKLAVGGTLRHPTLGITDPAGRGIDLRECGIHEQNIWEIIPDLAGFITYTGLAPYNVARRTGSIKFVIVTANPRGELMLRFVVRERSDADALASTLSALLTRLPQVVSVSANLHPEHKAVLEGPEEIHLYGPEFFEFPLPERTVYLHHRSFFQTNTVVASELYAQVSGWADHVGPSSVLDLYCGVGGFALHVAAPGRKVTGIEIEPDAIAAARAGLQNLPTTHGDVTFAVGDASEALDDRNSPDFIIVNPPRRGLGAELCARLESSTANHLVYSSCNPASLAKDLAALESWTVQSARLFDMFPQTEHSEVAVLLRR